MQGTINNNGNIQLSGGGLRGAYLGFNANTNLAGRGNVTLGGNGYNYLFENAGNVTLTNAGNTIQGAGEIGYNGLSVVNGTAGTILAEWLAGPFGSMAAVASPITELSADAGAPCG